MCVFRPSTQFSITFLRTPLAVVRSSHTGDRPHEVPA